MLLKENLSADIRSLSSGTFSKLLRDAYFSDLRRYLTSGYSSSRCLAAIGVDPHRIKNTWVIDRIQFSVARFAEVSPDAKWESWMDVWESYRKALRSVRFYLSYMGESEWTFAGKRYECKDHVSDYEKSIYNGPAEEFERCVVPRLGTVRRSYLASDGFPPDEVCVLFPFHTPAWCNPANDYALELHPDYPAPRIGRSVCGDRCNFFYDMSLTNTVEQYEEWRRIALAS